jgi:hypothetical protein
MEGDKDINQKEKIGGKTDESQRKCSVLPKGSIILISDMRRKQ